MSSFINRFELIVPFQYGFRHSSNTADALLEFTNRIHSSLDIGEISCSVYLDFRKAFDCVDINILLMKLHHLGFRGTVHSWLKSFLTNRYQYVSCGGASSQRVLVTRGVPQGSTLGPLLFLLYINDMHRCYDKFKYIHFADDTTVTCNGSNFNEVKNTAEEGLVRIKDWLICNRLSLNVNKSSFMIFTNKSIPQDFTLHISNDVITLVDSTRFLGVVIDSKLKFSFHIDVLAGKLSRVVGVIRKITCLINSHHMRTLYFSLFYSILIYGITVWGSAGTIQLSRIVTIYNRMVRLMMPGSTAQSFTTLKLLTFHDIYKYFILVKTFSVIKGGDNYFHGIFSNYLSNNNYSTRLMTNAKYILPRFHLSSSQRSFLYRGIIHWNDLPTELRTISQLNTFKFKLKNYVLSTT